MNFPKICVVVGIPGSGKSTYCEEITKNNPTFKCVSSDTIRKELLGSEEDQSDNSRVFYIMQNKALNYLEEGYNVLYDATNITRKSRAAILSKVPNWVQKEAIICWAPIEMCIERDANRERSVGKSVIQKMLRNYQVPYFDEGFDRITTKYPEGWDEAEQEYRKMLFSEDMAQDNPHHTLTLFEHMDKACAYVNIETGANIPYQPDLYYAAMWHDIGKKYTKSFLNSKGEVTETAHYCGHQGYSAWIVQGLSGCSNDIAWLINVHMDPYLDTKYYRNLPSWMKRKVDMLHEADVYAH